MLGTLLGRSGDATHVDTWTLAHRGDDFCQDAFEIQTGTISDELPNLADIRHATRHVFETLVVGQVVGHVHNLGIASGHGFNHMCQLVDSGLLRASDVKYLTHCRGMTGEIGDSFYEIADIAESRSEEHTSELQSPCNLV